MSRGLPTPFKTFIPRIYWEDLKTDVLADKADENIEAWFADVVNLERLHQIARCPANLIDELGYWLNAGLKNLDSDQEKRQKLIGAIDAHKRRGSWTEHAKPLIGQ